jgi:hypothetical protein
VIGLDVQDVAVEFDRAIDVAERTMRGLTQS